MRFEFETPRLSASYIIAMCMSDFVNPDKLNNEATGVIMSLSA